MSASPAFSSVVSKIGRNRLLRQIPLFAELDNNDLLAVQERLVERRFPAGAVVFNEGDEPDAFYIIVSGRVRVVKQSRAHREVTLAYLGRGDFFGEMGLVEDQPRSAGVVAVEPSRLLVLGREDFRSVLSANPLISVQMLRVLSWRLREESREQARARGTTFFKGMTIIARPDRCLSCRACETACAVSKSRTHTLYEAIYQQPAPVKRVHVRRTLKGSEPNIRPEHCYHCRDAPCLEECKFGAIKRDIASRTIVISEEDCRGCGLCARACPFDVITMIRSKDKRRVALKCTYCVEHPDGPACVRACPTNALVISLSTART